MTTPGRKISHLVDFQLHRDSYYGDITAGPKGLKFVALQAATHRDSKVLLQFNGGGSIPPFGLKTDNPHDSTYLIFNLEDEVEVDSLRRIQADVLQLAIANKVRWWPRGITDQQIKDNFVAIFTDKKVKNTDTEYWPAQIKVKIPLEAKTGVMKGSCDLQNDQALTISFTDLPYLKWDTVVVEFGGFYFSGQKWGLTKKLFKLKSTPLTKSKQGLKRMPYLPQAFMDTIPTQFTSEVHLQEAYLRLVQELNK